MSQYVLFFRHAEPKQEDLDQIAAAPGVRILDRSVSRAMLLEASPEAVSDLRSRLKDWTVAEQVTYPPPGAAKYSAGGRADD